MVSFQIQHLSHPLPYKLPVHSLPAIAGIQATLTVTAHTSSMSLHRDGQWETNRQAEPRSTPLSLGLQRVPGLAASRWCRGPGIRAPTPPLGRPRPEHLHSRKSCQGKATGQVEEITPIEHQLWASPVPEGPGSHQT